MYIIANITRKQIRMKKAAINGKPFVAVFLWMKDDS